MGVFQNVEIEQTESLVIGVGTQMTHRSDGVDGVFVGLTADHEASATAKGTTAKGTTAKGATVRGVGRHLRLGAPPILSLMVAPSVRVVLEARA